MEDHFCCCKTSKKERPGWDGRAVDQWGPRDWEAEGNVGLRNERGIRFASGCLRGMSMRCTSFSLLDASSFLPFYYSVMIFFQRSRLTKGANEKAAPSARFQEGCWGMGKKLAKSFRIVFISSLQLLFHCTCFTIFLSILCIYICI